MVYWVIFAITHIIDVAFNNLSGAMFHFEDKTTVDIINERNYPVETHTVTTDDGYVLTLHRIPYSRNSANASRGPVLLMHGLLCSSADWVILEEKSLGFILADAGFDVWMGNNRGNTYSHSNIHLDPILNNKVFFDFSYHEFGTSDLPAIIDYVLSSTNTTQIPYVGFSQGTTQFFVMASERPEYNAKILQANFWAPVTDMYRIQCEPINFLAEHRSVVKLENFADLYELFSHATVGDKLRAFCTLFDPICSSLFNLIGSSYERTPNWALKSQILQNFPAGMSMKQLYHYVQGARSGVFRPYDYGPDRNMEVYGKLLPNPYNISKLTVPTVFYYGGSDIFVNNEILKNDVARQMKNVTLCMVPLDNFNHLDFIWSTENDWLVQTTLKNLIQDEAGSTC